MPNWGKYGEGKGPVVHYDPLASFKVVDKIVGLRVHIIPSRGTRPRENILPSAVLDGNKEYDEEEREKSILFKIAMGRSKGVFLSGDDEILGSPTDDPRIMNCMDYNAISIVNKYPPLNLHGNEAPGVAMVVFPTNYIETLDRSEINTDILVALKSSINHLSGSNSYRDDLKTPLTFFNVGPSSGASIKLLHAQTYLTSHSAGILTYTFNRAYNATKSCTSCEISTSREITDHLGQKIEYDRLTVWEDDHVQLICPFAPFRPQSMRILLKNHLSHIGEATKGTLNSIGKALQLGHQSIIRAAPADGPVKKDRTIAFRQVDHVGKDFHMFIDILPSIPIGGAELIDSLSAQTLNPYEYAKRMRSTVNDIL